MTIFNTFSQEVADERARHILSFYYKDENLIFHQDFKIMRFLQVDAYGKIGPWGDQRIFYFHYDGNETFTLSIGIYDTGLEQLRVLMNNEKSLNAKIKSLVTHYDNKTLEKAISTPGYHPGYHIEKYSLARSLDIYSEPTIIQEFAQVSWESFRRRFPETGEFRRGILTQQDYVNVFSLLMDSLGKIPEEHQVDEKLTTWIDSHLGKDKHK